MSPGTPTRLRRVAPLAVAAMTLAVVAAACGSSATPAPTPTPTPPPDPKAMLANSAMSLTTLKSFHLDIALSGTIKNPGTSSGLPASVTFDGSKFTADVDVANQKANLTLALPAALLQAALASSGVPVASAIPAGDTADVIYAGDLYVKVPLLASMVGSDKWIKISSTSLQSLGNQFASGFASGFGGPIPSFSAALPSASPDLTAINALLGATGITVTSQGTDSCADGTCNKTVITVPASAIQKLEQMGAASSGGLSSSAPDLSSLGLGDSTLTIWTGASNDRFNKMQLAINAGTLGSLALTVTLSNFDQPVNVSAPPADQVTTIPGM